MHGFTAATLLFWQLAQTEIGKIDNEKIATMQWVILINSLEVDQGRTRIMY